MLHNTTIAYARPFGRSAATDNVPRSRMSFGGDRRGGFQSPVPMDIDTPPSTPYSRHAANAPSCDFVTFGTFGWPAGFSFEPSTCHHIRNVPLSSGTFVHRYAPHRLQPR